MILQAGPLLASFVTFDEITAGRHLVLNEFILYFALAGLLLTLLLDLFPR